MEAYDRLLRTKPFDTAAGANCRNADLPAIAHGKTGERPAANRPQNVSSSGIRRRCRTPGSRQTRTAALCRPETGMGSKAASVNKVRERVAYGSLGKQPFPGPYFHAVNRVHTFGKVSSRSSSAIPTLFSEFSKCCRGPNGRLRPFEKQRRTMRQTGRKQHVALHRERVALGRPVPRPVCAYQRRNLMQRPERIAAGQYDVQQRGLAVPSSLREIQLVGRPSAYLMRAFVQQFQTASVETIHRQLQALAFGRARQAVDPVADGPQ